MTLTGTYMTAGFTPFVVWSPVGTWSCCVPVLPGDDGADTAPLVDRTARCGHATGLFVGFSPTCGHHLRVMLRIAKAEPRGPIPDCERPR
jgi:hypothetical protein